MLNVSAEWCGPSKGLVTSGRSEGSVSTNTGMVKCRWQSHRAGGVSRSGRTANQ